MTKEQEFSIRGRTRSFKHATDGLKIMLKSQHNAWIHLAATIIVILTGLLLNLSANEWCWIVIAIVSVWTAEALNTAFEFLCDVASPEFNPLVKSAKDVAAGAVLISALGAFIIGSIILGPPLLSLIGMG